MPHYLRCLLIATAVMAAMRPTAAGTVDPNPPDASGNAKKPGAGKAAPGGGNSQAAAQAAEQLAKKAKNAAAAADDKSDTRTAEAAERFKQAAAQPRSEPGGPSEATKRAQELEHLGKLDGGELAKSSSEAAKRAASVAKSGKTLELDGAKFTQAVKQSLSSAHLPYLKKQGFEPETDKDGDIRFVRKGQPCFIVIDDSDSNFYNIVMPNVWLIRNEQERQEVTAAAAYANTTTIAAKVYPVGDSVWVAFEQYLKSPADAAELFPKAMASIDSARTHFERRMRKEE